jgi:protein-disulfide isomerase/uncharacterized membrane protein
LKNRENLSQKNRSSRFSPGVYFIAAISIAIGGIASSVYLALSHYRNFTDFGYQSFCAISRSLNCDTVSQSPYAIFSGVPVSVWGIGGYLFFLTLLFFFRFDKKANQRWALLCLLSILFSLISVVLAVVSSVYIHSYCIMCIFNYAINFMLLICTWIAQRRFGAERFLADVKAEVGLLYLNKVRISMVFSVFLVLTCAAVLYYPKYWLFPALPKGDHIVSGITEDGNPWIGAQHPLLTITEFTDYMCFQCGKMHGQLRRLVSAYPDRIRLVHRHFPLDGTVNPVLKDAIHENSGLLSMLAIYAQEKGKFWPVNDLLFRDAREKKKINLGSIGKESGMDIRDFIKRVNDRRLVDHLEADIRMGLRLGVTATPSYEINGKLYTGTIPEDVILSNLEEN